MNKSVGGEGVDNRNKLTALTDAKSQTTSFSYDELGRLINYTDAGADILNIGYPQHDKIGNRKQRSEDGTITDYSYDNLYRVTKAQTGPREENFTYDEVGNRESGPTVKDTPDKAYDHNAANQMLEGRKFTYAYDGQGNQSHRYLNAAKTKYWQYNWTVENQLQQAQLIKESQTLRTLNFKYDAFGRRIEKQVINTLATTTTTYVYDGEDIVLQLVDDGATTTTTQYLHGPGIDEPLAQVMGGQSYFYHADGLGSVLALTDSAKGIVQRYRYDTFGMLTSVLDSEFDNAYTYTAREWDRDLGLYYYRARYYDPMEGRFIGRDVIGFSGGDVNLYGYVGNNSVMRIDPSGKFPVYGYWCGPDWTGGYPKSWNNLSSAEKNKVTGPVDALDSCCEIHDKCYAKCRDDYPCDDDKRGDCFKKCDRKLSLCASKCNTDGIADTLIATYMSFSNP